MRPFRSTGIMIWAGVMALAVLAPHTTAAAQAQTASPPGVDREADRVMRQMSDYLASSRQFQFVAHDMIDEVLPTGQKIQLSNTRRVYVRRPDRVFIDLIGDIDREQICYDGQRLSVLDLNRNQHSFIATPDTIDATLDFLNEQHQTTVPLADLLFSDVYAAVATGIRYGAHVGMHHALGVRCHHLTFQQEGIDWQIWIEEGNRPVPRKLVITYKEFPGHPQYIALMPEWDMAASIDDKQFIFTPPPGAQAVDFQGRNSNPARPPASKRDPRAPANERD